MAKKKLHRGKIAGKDKEYFTANLAVLIKASVPIADAIVSMADSSPSRSLQKATINLSRDISEGYPLSQALKRNNLVNEQTLTLIEIGEQTGNLVENLALAAKQEQKQHYFKSKLLSAMLYPGFVLGVTLVIGLAIGWFLLPKLTQTFTSLDVELPLMSRVLLYVGSFLEANGIWAVPSILGAVFASVYILFVFPPTRTLGMRLLSHMPGIGKLMKELEIAKFGYLLSSLLDSGLSVTRSLELLSKTATLPKYKNYYLMLSSNFKGGYNFHDSFKSDKNSKHIIPSSVQQIVIGGERSGSLVTSLSSIGKIYEDKVEITTANFESVIEPILLVIVWLGVMFVALAVIVPVYSLLGGVSG